MNRGNENFREGSCRSFHRERKSREAEEIQSKSPPERDIKITVQSIENIDESKTKEIMVVIEFNGAIISQTPSLPITNSSSDIEATASIEIKDLNLQFLDDLLTNPVLFTVVDTTATSSSITESAALNLDKEAKKKASSLSKSFSFMQYGSGIIGICNLDIGSLATGKKIVRDILLVEPEKKLTPPEIIPWVKLPKLRVTASVGDEPLILESQNKNNNIIGITIESVYNFSSSLSDCSFFDAIIPVPSIGDKTRRVRFSNGEAILMKDPICRKKWLNLTYLQGRGGRCKTSISPRVYDVYNEVNDVDLEKEIILPNRLIEWNTWKSSLMSKSDICYFYGKIMKYRIWPVEILSQIKLKETSQKEKTAKPDKKSKPPTSKNFSTTDHFIAYLNLTPLLHPGVTKARVAAQLYTYSQTELFNKFGEDYGVLAAQSQTSSSLPKNKSNSRSRSFVETEEKKSVAEMPLFDEEGRPVFIIVEVELFKPINPKRNPEPLEADLKLYLSIKGEESKKTSNLKLMKENFSQTIRNAVSILTEEFQKFISSEREIKKSENLEVAFQKFLWNQESFLNMKSSLESKIIGLIIEKFGGLDQYKEKVPEIYVYLVNEMHKITNKCLLELKCVSNTSYSNDDILLYAEEAIEEGDFKIAKDYLLQRISKDTSNPNYWLDYAVNCVILKDYEAAIEAVKEALCLDFNHQIGLLMFALLMTIFKNGTLAEITFEILLHKYPEYIEGWMAFSLFYSTVDNSKSEIVARKEAERIVAEQKLFLKNNTEEKSAENSEEFCKIYPHNMEDLKQGRYGVGSIRNGTELVESLSWSLSFCPPYNVNIKTTVLLQKLGFYEFAAITLGQEMKVLKWEPHLSPPYVYYSCVNFYLEGRYEDAVLLLQDFVKEYGKDCFIWSLMGHCYYKLQNHSNAIACYEYVIESFNRPDDIHLVYSRMGSYYIQANKFECAKRVLKAAFKFSPTPKLWKKLGIAFLRLEEVEDADTAFSEANYLDNTDPDTWAYLGITNAMLQRLDLFQQCCLEAKKRDFNNPELIKEIQALALLNHLKGILNSIAEYIMTGESLNSPKENMFF